MDAVLPYLQKMLPVWRLMLYYRPQRSCEGYDFTGVCHSVHRGGYPSMHCRWYPSMPCSRGCAIPACLAAGGVPAPGGCLLPGGACSGGSAPRGCGDPLEADGYCCGRYASYWNAFLFTMVFWYISPIWPIDYFALKWWRWSWVMEGGGGNSFCTCQNYWNSVILTECSSSFLTPS